MKICVISDTHGKHKRLHLPEADVIIHCGDFTTVGKDHEIFNFMKWFNELNYEYKIIIAGNHDMLFDREGHRARLMIPKNVIYLEDSGIKINGINFYGTPVSKVFGNWAFMKSEDRLNSHWNAIPEDTDVLITHTPLYGILDNVPWDGSQGSETLRDHVINRIKPKFHLFGHIHEGYGLFERDGITFINASNLDGDYMCVNDPITFEI